MSELPLTIADAAEALRKGETTSVALTTAMLERADHLDPILGTYLHRSDQAALVAAAEADSDFAAGIDRGPLQGIPLGIKDIIATKDAPTTAQSLILDPGWGESWDAPVVARLRATGAVIMGKTTTMEFACGYPDPDMTFPMPRNPWNTERWTGGSSSGTGNGVAAGLFYGGLGTDTGGSIRIPSAFCGISGIKPTFGLVPKSGCTPAGYSLDHIGPMARSARDCAIMLQVMAGYDPSDLCSADVPVPDYLTALDTPISGMRIGVERAHHLVNPNNDPALMEVFERAVAELEAAGATVVEVEIPEYDRIASMINSIGRAEALSYHLLDLQTRAHLYGRHTADFLQPGALITGAQYAQAQRFRMYAKKLIADFMADFDALVMPTTGAAALSFVGLTSEAMFTTPNYTRFWDAVGLPALAVPMGFNRDGLPLSLQVAAKAFDDATALKVGHAYQQRTDWHLQVPMMATQAVAA